jgi:alanine racemase
MDLITVDLGASGEARVGDPVELWGENLSANEVAAHCDTIAYELVTRVAARVPRHYVGGNLEEGKESR